MYYLGVRAGFTLNLFSEKEKRMPLQSLTQLIKRIFKLIIYILLPLKVALTIEKTAFFAITTKQIATKTIVNLC